jgi:hypothetical protein
MRPLRSVGKILVQGHLPLEAADHFVARRVHFPAGPRLLEAKETDDSALVQIIGMALAIGLIPFGTSELRLIDGAGSAAEVDRKIVEGLASHETGASSGAQAA